MAKVQWATYNGWSGPWIKGVRAYVPASYPTTWENVLVYAVAYPEGGTWDGIVAYDGTACTAALFQWTLTSTRLQKLLEVCRPAAPVTWSATVGKLFAEWHLILTNGKICNDSGTPLSVPSGLRAKFTPPDGKTPRTGTNWNLASYSVTMFNALFLDPKLDAVQQAFFLNELQYEATLKRPKMSNTTINSILYPAGWPTAAATAVFPDDAARAMFWSFWQNSPRKAEEYLYAVNNAVAFKADPLSFTIRLARTFAHSSYANWGIDKAALCEKCGTQNAPYSTECDKCGADLRESRYSKIVNCINKQMACKLPKNP